MVDLFVSFKPIYLNNLQGNLCPLMPYNTTSGVRMNKTASSLDDNKIVGAHNQIVTKRVLQI